MYTDEEYDDMVLRYWEYRDADADDDVIDSMFADCEFADYQGA